MTPHKVAASCCNIKSHTVVNLVHRQNYRQADVLIGHTYSGHTMSGVPTQIHSKFKFYYKIKGTLEYSVTVTPKIQRNSETLLSIRVAQVFKMWCTKNKYAGC